jgi:hypothetical protein
MDKSSYIGIIPDDFYYVVDIIDNEARKLYYSRVTGKQVVESEIPKDVFLEIKQRPVDFLPNSIYNCAKRQEKELELLKDQYKQREVEMQHLKGKMLSKRAYIKDLDEMSPEELHQQEDELAKESRQRRDDFLDKEKSANRDNSVPEFTDPDFARAFHECHKASSSSAHRQFYDRYSESTFFNSHRPTDTFADLFKDFHATNHTTSDRKRGEFFGPPPRSQSTSDPNFFANVESMFTPPPQSRPMPETDAELLKRLGITNEKRSFLMWMAQGGHTDKGGDKETCVRVNGIYERRFNSKKTQNFKLKE